MSTKDTLDTFMFTIQSPANIIWSGQVYSVHSKNEEGEFTIFPDHANFLSPIVKEAVIVTFGDGTERNYNFNHSVLYVRDGEAILYVNDFVDT